MNFAYDVTFLNTSSRGGTAGWPTTIKAPVLPSVKLVLRVPCQRAWALKIGSHGLMLLLAAVPNHFWC